jgi:hypothetical protein
MHAVNNGVGACTVGKCFSGKGCSGDSDCGSGMLCDTFHMQLPRKDSAKAGYMPLCKKAKSCIPCDYAGDCASKDGGASCVAAKDENGATLGYKVCAKSCF